jgi:hypothetical protein
MRIDLLILLLLLPGAYSSTEAQSTAVLYDYKTFTFVDLVKGTVRELPKEYDELSPDYRYNYYCGGMLDIWQSDGVRVKKAKIIVKAMDGSSRDTLVGDHFGFGVDAQGRVIATRAVLNEAKNRLACFIGLYTLDRKTGQELSTLRTDTIYKPGRFGFGSYGPDYSYGAPEKWSLQPSYLLIKAATKRLQVFPFNSTDVATIHYEELGDERFEPELMDEGHVYMHTTGFRAGQDLLAYSRRSGALAARHKFPEAKNHQMLYAMGANRLYRYDREKAMAYVEEPRAGVFVATDSFKVAGLSLPYTQRWVMQVCKGPSLFFTPLEVEPGEAGGAATNTASLVQLPTGRISLRITPFYNRSTAIAAQQAADQKAFNEMSAQHNRESEQRQKEQLAERCKTSWNNVQYRKGLTKQYDGNYVILESYDCAKDEFRYFLPRQPEDWDEKTTKSGWRNAGGESFRYSAVTSSKQYHTCNECGGEGKVLRTTTTTRTKDLPWGYFSGVETTSTRTTTKQEVKLCLRCGGRGVVLE